MEQDYLISNKTYDLLNRFVTLVLPATATLYAALGAIWGLPNPEAVVATFAAVATFGGVLIRFSNKSWNESDAKFDGELVASGTDPDTGLPNLQLTVTTDPNELADMDTILLKSIDNR